MTPKPTKTLHISPTPVPTFQLLITSTNSMSTPQTYSTIQTLAAKYSSPYPGLLSCNYGKTIQNGEWIFFEKGLHVVRLDGRKIWDLNLFFDTYGKQYKSQYSSIEIAHWSKDGKYLYFSPCYTLESIFPTVLLYRLDLENGEVTNTHFDYESSFSLDDRYIVYADGDFIRINEIQSGIEFFVDMSWCECDDFGWFAWSPDSQFIAFSTVKYDPRIGYSSGIYNNYKIYLITLKDLSVKELIDKQGYFREYFTEAWLTSNLIKLWNYEDYAVYNIEEGRLYLLSFVTPTP